MGFKKLTYALALIDDSFTRKEEIILQLDNEKFFSDILDFVKEIRRFENQITIKVVYNAFDDFEMLVESSNFIFIDKNLKQKIDKIVPYDYHGRYYI